MKLYSIACVLAVLLSAMLANGQPTAAADPGRSAKQDGRLPQLIGYQGKLTDATGRPVDDGSYVMVFSLYADSTGGSFWHETQTVETRGGLFSVLLGSNVSISADAMRQGGCYLGIRVLPATDEFHRQRIASVPFAMQADNADRFQGRDSVALDSVYVSHADTDAVTSVLIEDGTITRADVAPGFRAPYADTADYARRGSDSARVAGNSHRFQGKDTTGFVRTGQADAVTSAMIAPNTIVRADVAADFKAPFSDTADFARVATAMDSARVAGNAHLFQTKDTAYFAKATHSHAFVDSSRIAAGSYKLQGKDTTALWNAKTLQGKDTTGFVRPGQASSVTGAMVVDGTIARVDVASSFKAPLSDTADYARAAPAMDSARVAGNAHRLQGKDTTALWNAKALQGKDTTGFVRPGQASSVTGAMVVDGTIARVDVASNFKAPMSDTADYARAAPATDSARVAGNAYRLQGKDTTALGNAKTLQGKDTTGFVRTGQASSVTGAMLADGTVMTADVGDTAVTMAKLARAGATTGEVIKWTGSAWEPGPDNTGGGSGVTNVYQAAGVVCTPNPITSTGTVGFDSTWGASHYVNEGQISSVNSAMIVDGTVARADVASGFKAPYSDTADYARAAPATDSARVAGNAYRLQGKDTTALGNAKTLQGKDTTGFVRPGQANSVTGTMVVDGTIARVDVAANFKAPLSDTADYARAAPAVDSARVAGNAHRLQGKDTTALGNAKTLQGKDTTALDGRYVNEAQTSSVTGVMLVDATVKTADVADTAVTMAKLAQAGATTGEVIKWTGTTWEPGPDNTGGGSGVTNVYQAAGIICTPNPITSTGTVGFDSTWGASHYVNEGQASSITSAMITDGTVVRADVAAGFKAPFSDTADYARAAPGVDSARVAGNSHLLQGKDTTGFVRTGQADAVTSTMIAPNTIVRADVATNFKAPLSDTADYARAAPATDSARVAGNSHMLQGKDTTALWNAKTLQGKDTSGFVRTGQADAVTSAMIVPNTIARGDVATDFKAPFSDTADYARAAPATDSARVAGNSYLLQGKDTTGFVRTGQADAVTSTMIAPNTIVRADVASNFQAPFSDTADYARAAPATDSARVAGNSHLLQGKDTTALGDAKTLQGKDTTGFVRTDQANSVTSDMLVDNTVTPTDVERGSSADSGKTIISQGAGHDPVWGYPAAVGDSGTRMTFIKTGVCTLNINPSIPADSVREVSVTIAGLAEGDLVFLSHPIRDANGDPWPSVQGLGNCEVTGSGTLTFRVWNSSDANVNPGAGVWRYVWIRQ